VKAGIPKGMPVFLSYMHNKNRKSLQQRSGNKVKLIYSFSYFVLIIGCYYLLKSGRESGKNEKICYYCT
jgi:hypothetical protein